MLCTNQCLCECERVRVFVCGGLASRVPPLTAIKDVGYLSPRAREVCDDTVVSCFDGDKENKIMYSLITLITLNQLSAP